MKKTRLVSNVAGLVLAPGLLFAQTTQTTGMVYQQAGVIGIQSGVPGAMPAMQALPDVLFGKMNPDTIAGSPFSATDESHSLQVLGDGTRIEHTESNRIYRDSQGRTRMERGSAGAGMIVIQDPVGGFNVTLNAADKTAHKMPLPPHMGKFTAAVGGLTAGAGTAGARIEIRNAVGGAVPAPPGAFFQSTMVTKSLGGSVKPVSEDLGNQNVNGVLATGKKTTLTIPAGEIGNDRPILVVGETWYSGDLQMLVKSSNSDPRFGDTTFELNNINRAEPDPTLFQVPSDYTLAESKNFEYKVLQQKE
jgi:hypothetical protein